MAWLALLASGCVVPSLLDDRPCPCADGWSCDPARDVCVRGTRDAGSTDAGASDSGSADSGLADTGPADAGPAVSTACWVSTDGCDWSAPGGFDFFEDDGTALSNVSVTGNAILSPDACSLYYESDGDVFVAERANGSSAFGLGESVGAINTPEPEVRGTVSPDGRELLFVRRGTFARVFRTRRGARTDAWGSGEPVDVLNGAYNSFDVALAPHGLDVYFTRLEGAVGKVYMAERPALDAEFGAPALVADLSAEGSVEAEASVTADDRVIVIISSRPGETERQAYYATRSGRGEPWGALNLVTGPFFELDREEDIAVSPDGCEMFVQRRGELTRLTYQAR